MSGCEISGESIAKIINADKNLQVLNVSNNYLNCVDEDLARTIGNAALWELCIVSEGAMLVAEAIGKNITLQELDISHNHIGDSGSIAIGKQLKFNKTLRYLNLSANRITNTGAVCIAEALYVCTTLCQLNISENRITYEGVISFLGHIQVNTTLKTLVITHNDITKTGLSCIENYIKKMCSSLVIHTSWNEVVMSYKQIVLKLHHISLNTAVGASSGNQVISHDGNILLFKTLDDQNYGSVLLCNCLKENNTLKEFYLSRTNVIVSSEKAKKIVEVLKVNKTLVKFNFSECTLSADAVMALRDSLIHNTTLQELSVGCTGITNIDFILIMNALRLNSTLVKLDISHNSYLRHGDAVDVLSSYLLNNATLIELNLRSNNIAQYRVEKIMKALSVNTALQKLVISHNPIYDAGAIAISNCLQCNNSLKVLCISFCFISSVGALEIAKALKVNKTLQKLDISQNKAIFSETLVEFTTFLKENHTLKKLNLSGHYRISAGIKQTVIQNCMTLKQLDLTCHKFDAEAVAAICDSIKGSTTVKKLSISHCNITSSGIKSITEVLISFRHSLKKLDISSNNLSDDGAEAIGEYLGKNSILCELNLSCTGITMLGAAKIAEGLKANTALRKLDISHNSISDDGATVFGDCLNTNNTLVKLDLSFNGITVNSMTIFAEAIQANTGLRTLKLLGICDDVDCEDTAVKFIMTILGAMYMNKRN